VAVCPVDSIHPNAQDGPHAEEEMVYINPLTCIDCGLCVDECPHGAVFSEEDLPTKWRSFVERNASYYTLL
jgi:NAD-dependent dihydropyrimidine dehydrogenase PreA subunit